MVWRQQEVVEGVHLYMNTILPCPMDYTRVTLIVSACQPGWEEMENLRGNLRGNKEGMIQNEVSLGGSPTINVTLDNTNITYVIMNNMNDI